MTISWYSITILPESGGAVFNGYFSVDNTTNLVTGFYDLSLPTGTSYTDVLLPIDSPDAWPEPANNIYPITFAGLHFYSTALQNFFSIGQNNFNLFYDSEVFFIDRLATTATDTLTTPIYTINFAPIFLAYSAMYIPLPDIFGSPEYESMPSALLLTKYRLGLSSTKTSVFWSMKGSAAINSIK